MANYTIELARLRRAEEDAARAAGLYLLRQRADSERRLKAEDIARRAECRARREGINSSVVAQLVDVGISIDAATMVVRALAANKIKGISIEY